MDPPPFRGGRREAFRAGQGGLLNLARLLVAPAFLRGKRGDVRGSELSAMSAIPST